VARAPELELTVHTSIGIVRPGEKLVVAVDETRTDMDIDVLKRSLEDQLPGVKAVVIRAEGIVVYRP
jgi:hypothetical protein